MTCGGHGQLEYVIVRAIDWGSGGPVPLAGCWEACFACDGHGVEGGPQVSCDA